MSTYTQIIYHVVFATKDRKSVLKTDRREDLFKYIWGIVKNRNCHLYRINGFDDHLHLLISVHPTVTLAGLVKDIKTGSSRWIRQNDAFKGFMGWQQGYGAFTHSVAGKEALMSYIKSQEDHHRKTSFREELIALLKEAGLDYDEKFLP